MRYQGEVFTVRNLYGWSAARLSPGELSGRSATHPTTRSQWILWFPCDSDNSVKSGRIMDRENIPLRRCLEDCPYDSAGHDRAENNGSETAIDAQECCNK